MKSMLKIAAVVASAAIAMGFAACSNNDAEDLGTLLIIKNKIAEQRDAAGLIDYTECVVGQEITFQGETYKVLRNDFLEEENSSSSSSNKNVLSNVAVNVSRAVITTNSNSGSEYQNENAKKLRYDKIEKDYGVSKCIELFNVTNNNISNTNGTATLEDKFLICDKEEPIYQIKQVWSSATLFSGTTAEKAAAFNALTENEIRAYDPDYFTFTSRASLYGDDLSKKVQTEYQYTRNAGEKTCDYTSLVGVKDWKDFKKMSDGNEKSVWRTETYYTGSEIKNINYVLHAPSGSNFFSFNITSNKIEANGDGTLNGSTSKSVWRGDVRVKSVTSTAAEFQVTLKDQDELVEPKNNAGTNGKTFKVKSYSSLDSTKEATTSDAEYYITVSSEKTKLTVNGTETEVPSAVTFRAPFKDTSVALQPYTSISWKPEVESGAIVYKPDYESWIAAYDADFATLYDKSIQ